MAKFRSIKNAFITGQISPKAFGRTDLQQYANACETLENMIPYPTGGAYRRPGTLLLDKDPIGGLTSSKAIYPFVFSKSEATAFTYNLDADGDPYFSVVDGLSVATADLGWEPNTQVAASVANVVPGYDQYLDMATAQSADTMWLCNPNNEPHVVRRFGGIGAYSYTANPLRYGLAPSSQLAAFPFGRMNTTTTQILVASGDHTTAGASIVLEATDPIFNVKHIGAMFKIKKTTVGGVVITGFTNTTHVTATVLVPLGGSTGTTDWWESDWSDYRGWPRAIAFYGKRLVYGGNAAYPDRLWFSKKNNYFEMQYFDTIDPFEESNSLYAFTSELPSNQLNEINWLDGGNYLFCGTSGAEFTISQINGLLDKTNISIVKQSSYGSAYVQPTRGGNELFFVTPSGNSIVSLVYNNDEQSYKADPIQILFDEYPRVETQTLRQANNQIRKIAWDDSRKTLWAIDTDGNFFGCTRDRSTGILAWHKHTLAGTDRATRIDLAYRIIPDAYYPDPVYTGYVGYVVSMAIVPNATVGYNDIFLTVIRQELGGTFAHSVEIIQGGGELQESNKGYNPFNVGLSTVYLDEAMGGFDFTVSDPTIDIPAPDLAGQTCQGVVINEYGIFEVGSFTVGNDGVWNMPTPYPTGWGDGVTRHTVYAGTPFRSTVKPVRLEAGSQIGSAQGAIKKIHKIILRLYKTMTCSVGPDMDHLEDINFREGSTPMNESADLFTGDKVLTFDSDYDRDGYIVMTTDNALPMNVISVIAEGVTYD